MGIRLVADNIYILKIRLYYIIYIFELIYYVFKIMVYIISNSNINSSGGQAAAADGRHSLQDKGSILSEEAKGQRTV